MGAILAVFAGLCWDSTKAPVGQLNLSCIQIALRTNDLPCYVLFLSVFFIFFWGGGGGGGGGGLGVAALTS